MTPIILVSFLVSLAWVDFRYSLQRSQNHPDEPGPLPRWLLRILYRPSSYRYVKVAKTTAVRPENSNRWFYHSHQKKLMKMEADEAFQIRSVVLLVLAVLLVVATSGVLIVGRWAWIALRGY